MAFFSLFGRLGLNTKEFDSGLDRSEKKAVGFADRVEKKVGKKLDKAFGTGLVTGAILGQVHQFFDLFKNAGERAKQISEMSSKLGIGVEEFQALELAAAEAGMSVEEFLKSVSQSGKVEQTIQRIAELRKQIKFTADDVDNFRGRDSLWKNLQNSIDWLNIEAVKRLEQGATIFLRQQQLIKEGMKEPEALRLAQKEFKESQTQQRLNQAVQNKVDEDKLRGMMAPPPEQAKLRERAASLTPFQQIGAYVATPGDVMLREQKNTNDILRRIETLSRQQLQTMSRSNPFL